MSNRVADDIDWDDTDEDQMDNGEYADLLTYRVGGPLNPGNSEVNRVILVIRNGPAVVNYWHRNNDVWMNVERVRRGRPSDAVPLPRDTGVCIARTINRIIQGCNSQVQPVSPVTRAMGLYSLAHIADWIWDYTRWFRLHISTREGFQQRMRPFNDVQTRGPLTHFRSAIVGMDSIIGEMSVDEHDLILRNLWDMNHLGILQNAVSPSRLNRAFRDEEFERLGRFANLPRRRGEYDRV